MGTEPSQMNETTTFPRDITIETNFSPELVVERQLTFNRPFFVRSALFATKPFTKTGPGIVSQLGWASAQLKKSCHKSNLH